ncbi:uncharacterized protein LOC117932613 [Vitis riparia]|uniref:uncharacterized protein LOC117932613 n=1 Tax=Vitis riparia TaxID=96939 RepID=UPI00155A45A2|nr:uncharacterized protein LOC117932613 [Vitis riparia]
MLSLISSSIKANCEHSLREVQSQRIKSTVSVSLSSLSSIHCELGRCVNGIGESSECVASSGCHHHHRSSLRHHQNGVVSGVLRRSLTVVLELLKCSVCFDFMYLTYLSVPQWTHTLLKLQSKGTQQMSQLYAAAW